jgi:hypothetical protein
MLGSIRTITYSFSTVNSLFNWFILYLTLVRLKLECDSYVWNFSSVY